ncbi:MAG TPA: glycosyltransferase family 2 protein [Polyangiaceae bacterium]|nr:glycosyltransferase family 2 protein [Polyangiaceae bacterium]
MMQPFVTIAMPCLNEEAYIESCIRTVLSQDYPRDRLELVVADGMSMDATREILARLATEDPRIRVIDNPARIQSAGINAVLAVARGEILVRMDVHCEYAHDYVSQCVRVLVESGADNVGGAQRARAKSLFQRALCAALDSPLGVGGAKYRSPESEGFVDTVFLGAFRRRVFEKMGMYDPKAVTNEDAELNQRIIEGGGKVYLSKDIVVHYFPRGSFQALAKQYYKYGQGRARTLLKRGKFLSIRPAIPFLVTLSGAAMLLTSPFQPFTPLAFAAYALATGAEAVRVGRALGPLGVPLVWAMFPVVHVSHGIGFGVGLVKYTLSPDWPAEPERLAPLDPTLGLTPEPSTP